MGDVISLLLIFGAPFAVVVGGVVAAILKIRGEQRVAELVYQERLAAIEKGLDPGTLPSPALPYLTPRQISLRRAQGLLIGGLLTLALGGGLMLMLFLLPNKTASAAWPVGFVPLFIGVALLVSTRIVRSGVGEE